MSSLARLVNSRALFPAFVAATWLTGCAGSPPGADFPRTQSVALQHPEGTVLGERFAGDERAHADQSGFRILNVGVDGFLTRVQMIEGAQRTLDLQYFIFRGDETGRLITAAVLRAADRGVRVRVLIDDGDTLAGDEQLMALAGSSSIEIRIFNPFFYRGHIKPLRATEFLFNWRRLDYRMHNKLLVADNAVALIGGRNIGNQYFQMDPGSQFADDDVFCVGPVVRRLSAVFDEFWSSPLAIPVAALSGGGNPHRALEEHRRRERGRRPMDALDSRGVDYVALLRTGEPYAGMISGRLPLTWGTAQVVADSPDKKKVEDGARQGRLMALAVIKAAAQVREELLMITPYFIPSKDELTLLQTLLHRDVRVAILTNSLDSTPDLVAQAGYVRYRRPLLEEGAELYEARSLLGNTKGSGQSKRIAQFGNYALHAKLFVFDRRRLFIGSMNYDRRSRHLNTEVGLIIDSQELAEQEAKRFSSMTQPENAFALSLRDSVTGHEPVMIWTTVANGRRIEYIHEPSRSRWRRWSTRMMAFLPVGSEL